MELKSLVEKVAELFERAAFKLGRDRAAIARFVARRGSGHRLPFLLNKRRRVGAKNRKLMRGKDGMVEEEEEEEEEEEVWRRTIIMGEKCQPLEFSGVIYYDCDGKRVATAPRSPFRAHNRPQSSLYSF